MNEEGVVYSVDNGLAAGVGEVRGNWLLFGAAGTVCEWPGADPTAVTATGGGNVWAAAAD